MCEKERHHATTLACGCCIGGENEPPVVHCPMHAAAERMRNFIDAIATAFVTPECYGREARAILRDIDR